MFIRRIIVNQIFEVIFKEKYYYAEVSHNLSKDKIDLHIFKKDGEEIADSGMKKLFMNEFHKLETGTSTQS